MKKVMLIVEIDTMIDCWNKYIDINQLHLNAQKGLLHGYIVRCYDFFSNSCLPRCPIVLKGLNVRNVINDIVIFLSLNIGSLAYFSGM